LRKFLLPFIVMLLTSGPTAWGQSAAPVVKKMPQSAPSKAVVAPDVLIPVDLSPEQLAIADRVALGKMPCELSAHVMVRLDPAGPGRFILELGKEKFFMAPVVSQTGAIRLEDPRAGAVWIQLGNKSMLMSQRLGRRLADACVSPDQALVAKELERNPVPGLLDAPAPVLASGNAPVPAASALAETEPNR
jgi:hypothetical protein